MPGCAVLSGSAFSQAIALREFPRPSRVIADPGVGAMRPVGPAGIIVSGANEFGGSQMGSQRLQTSATELRTLAS
jgi:hypothetical protein